MSMEHMRTLEQVCKDLGLRVSGGTGFGYLIDDCGLLASKVILPPDSDPSEKFPNTVGFPCVKIYQQVTEVMEWFIVLEYDAGEINVKAVIQVDYLNYATVRNAVSKLYDHCPLEWEVVEP